MRHITDRNPVPEESGRFGRGIHLSRQSGEAGLHPATKALTRRYIAAPDKGLRLQQFMRIVRGQMA